MTPNDITKEEFIREFQVKYRELFKETVHVFEDTGIKLSLQDYEKIVCKYFGITPADLRVRSRKRIKVLPRHWFYYLTMPHFVPEFITDYLGFERTTVYNSVSTINDMLHCYESDQLILKELQYAEAKMKSERHNQFMRELQAA